MSPGIAWIRTADLIVLAVETGSMSAKEGIAGLATLEASGRITSDLAAAYREQLQCELSKQDALIAYRQGRITLREFASLLNIGIWAAHNLLLAEGGRGRVGDRVLVAADDEPLSAKAALEP